MKNNQFVHSRQSDALVINDDTVHQYYNTVQSDVGSDRLLDDALDRRRERGLAQRRRQPWLWVGAVAVIAVVLGVLLA